MFKPNKPQPDSIVFVQLEKLVIIDTLEVQFRRSGLTQDNKMSACLFQCDVSHQ